MASLDNGEILRPSRIKTLPEGHLALMASTFDKQEAGEPVQPTQPVDIRAQDSPSPIIN